MKFLLALSFLFLILLTPKFLFARDVPLFAGCNPDEYVAGPGSTEGTVDCEPSVTKPVVPKVPTIGTIDQTKTSPTPLKTIISNSVNVIVAVAGLVFFFMLLLGGFRYLTSNGDEKASAAARNTLTNAFIGLIIVVASFLIAQLIFYLFKIPGIVVSNP